MKPFFELSSAGDWALLAASAVLLLLLVVSFRSRSYVFCQYLKAMTGISLKPREVRKAFRLGEREGVRELFLDLIIQEDLKQGPAAIPDDARPAS